MQVLALRIHVKLSFLLPPAQVQTVLHTHSVINTGSFIQHTSLVGGFLSPNLCLSSMIAPNLKSIF
jgi:hypothetical protein